jgi:hypothetical protein
MEIGSSIPVLANQLQTVAAPGARPDPILFQTAAKPVEFLDALGQYRKLTRFRHSIYPARPP